VLFLIYGCESWSLAFREDRGLRVSDSGLSRRIFGHERVKVTGDWKKLRNDELHALYCTLHQIALGRWNS